MTKIDKYKIQLLTDARKLIVNNTERYICSALDNALTKTERRIYRRDREEDIKDTKLLRKATKDLFTYISKSLGKHGFYHQWLWAKSLDYRVLPTFSKERDAADKDGRLAWIDWMIHAIETQS